MRFYEIVEVLPTASAHPTLSITLYSKNKTSPTAIPLISSLNSLKLFLESKDSIDSNGVILTAMTPLMPKENDKTSG